VLQNGTKLGALPHGVLMHPREKKCVFCPVVQNFRLVGAQHSFSATMASTYSTYHLRAVAFLKFLVVEKICLELWYSCVQSTKQCATDRIIATRLVCFCLGRIAVLTIGRIYVRSRPTAMRPNNTVAYTCSEVTCRYPHSDSDIS